MVSRDEWVKWEGREGRWGRTVDRTADGEIVHCDLSITFQVN